MNWVKELPAITKWKKYSQSHEEAYLAHILKNIISVKKFLLELGAWDGFHLSNTRYFIEQGYEHLLIDGDNHGNEEVKKHFITRENIIEILNQYDCPKQFDLFCIDLDGNDIYILETVLQHYKPSVIIAEFNPIFSSQQSFTIAYNPEHFWSNDNFYGFSFAAGLKLANKFNYTCIFQNDDLNMYFVANDILAASLGISEKEIHLHVPTPTYREGMQYHPQSTKKDWAVY